QREPRFSRCSLLCACSLELNPLIFNCAAASRPTLDLRLTKAEDPRGSSSWACTPRPRDLFAPSTGTMVSMSSEVQPRPDDSPNTSGGSSDAEQREAAPPEQPGPEQRDQSQPKKKEAKISSKTAAKLSTSAKR
ncbi:hypothetical protein GOODEAATRI_010783, partial [Goodea atripinnis]